MTNEQAKEMLQGHKELIKEVAPTLFVNALEVALEAIEKQIPKKVEGHRDCCSYKFYKCPSCKTDLIMRSQYCDKCGQRLEW